MGQSLKHRLAVADDRIEHLHVFPLEILVVFFFNASADDYLNPLGKNHVAEHIN